MKSFEDDTAYFHLGSPGVQTEKKEGLTYCFCLLFTHQTYTHQLLKLFPSGAQAASVSLSITVLTAFFILFFSK